MSVRLFVRAVLAAAALVLAAPATAGASFTVVPSPNAPVGESVLTGVRASSATDAWAVGSSCCAARNFGRAALTEHWNGSAWSVVPSLDTRFNDELLNAVIDISPSNAWAVGETKQSGYRSGAPLILHWDGASWEPVAPPGGTTGKLLATARSSPTDLWAVGDQTRSKTSTGVPPGTRTLAMRWDGSVWAAVPTPNLGDEDTLRGVVANAGGMTAVGAFQDATTGALRTLAERWNGTSWAVRPTPNVGAADNFLRAASPIPGSRDVWAVGSHLTVGGPTQTLVLRGH